MMTKGDSLQRKFFLSYLFPPCVAVIAVAIGIFLQIELNNLERLISSSQTELNNTMRAERQDLLIFNRVPKVGSQTLFRIMNAMAAVNNFTSYKDDGERVRQYGETTMIIGHNQRIEFCKMFEQFNYPASYTKHIAFIDFEELESLRGNKKYAKQFASFQYTFQRPIYINMVREPVDRIISWYYYTRAPWYIVEKETNGKIDFKDNKSSVDHTVKSLKQSYEACVHRGDPECLYLEGENFSETGNGGQHASQIMFFCGHKPYCSIINGKQAFNRAIENVEKHYAVVGVLEEMEKSMKVFSHYIPKFFSGVEHFYESIRKDRREVNKNIYRPKVEERVKNLVRLNLTREVDFYNFCRQRLHKQLLLIKN